MQDVHTTTPYDGCRGVGVLTLCLTFEFPHTCFPYFAPRVANVNKVYERCPPLKVVCGALRIIYRSTLTFNLNMMSLL